MFFTFLNKEQPSFLDVSLFTTHFPDVVLTYYYNSKLKISLSTILELKNLAAANTNAGAPIREWEMFYNELNLDTDIDNFVNSEYLITIGPYYYPLTNTSIYITKEFPSPSQLFTSEDLDTFIKLDSIPELNNDLYNYYRNRKNSKKAVRNENELIKDIDMCLMSLKEIEKVNRQINYLNKFLEKRSFLVEQESLLPPEPDNLPPKPQKEEEKEISNNNLIPFNLIINRKKKARENEAGSNYNHDMKVYIIRYREYEKACDRYKAVLENWLDYCETLKENCLREIEMAEYKIKRHYKNLQVYNTILVKSPIHSIYQDPQTLRTFRHYLETGRAQNLQECMNLFEEECHWSEIKASQERIENTIYFMQGANDDYRLASENIDRIIKSSQEKKAGGE
ncbi:MAG: hypothetical protein ACOX6E_00305 [Syntrophomonadaceae bacterium]